MPMSGGGGPHLSLAAAADDLVRAHPRLLLSSFGVLGRVVFLAQQMRQQQQQHLAESDCGVSGGVSAADGVDGITAKAAIMAPASKFRASQGDAYASYLRGAIEAHYRWGASAADGVDLRLQQREKSAAAEPAAQQKSYGTSSTPPRELPERAALFLKTIQEASVEALEKEHGEILKKEMLFLLAEL